MAISAGVDPGLSASSRKRGVGVRYLPLGHKPGPERDSASPVIPRAAKLS